MGKFFFDADEEVAPQQKVATEETTEFLDSLHQAGLIHDTPLPFFEEKKRAEEEVAAGKAGGLTTEILGSMNKLKSTVLEVEFGTYDQDYSLHLTPIHERYNLKSDHQVEEALKECVSRLSVAVPSSLKVEIHLPRPDWKMKVISFVIKGGAKAWNLDIPQLEKETIPAIFEAVQKVITK